VHELARLDLALEELAACVTERGDIVVVGKQIEARGQVLVQVQRATVHVLQQELEGCGLRVPQRDERHARLLHVHAV